MCYYNLYHLAIIQVRMALYLLKERYFTCVLLSTRDDCMQLVVTGTCGTAVLGWAHSATHSHDRKDPWMPVCLFKVPFSQKNFRQTLEMYSAQTNWLYFFNLLTILHHSRLRCKTVKDSKLWLYSEPLTTYYWRTQYAVYCLWIYVIFFLQIWTFTWQMD